MPDASRNAELPIQRPPPPPTTPTTLRLAPPGRPLTPLLSNFLTPAIGVVRVSSLPERHGCDILTLPGRIGFQRKTIPDLIASLYDGRLNRELSQIASSPLLKHAILVIEGRPQYTRDDSLILQFGGTGQPVSRDTFEALLCSVQLSGLFVFTTDNIRDTIRAIANINRWFLKPRHDSLSRRPKGTSTFGRRAQTNSKPFATHLLQSFPSVGPGLADAIYDTFGKVPLAWTVSEKDLERVPGIGKQRAETLYRAL